MPSSYGPTTHYGWRRVSFLAIEEFIDLAARRLAQRQIPCATEYQGVIGSTGQDAWDLLVPPEHVLEAERVLKQAREEFKDGRDAEVQRRRHADRGGASRRRLL